MFCPMSADLVSSSPSYRKKPRFRSKAIWRPQCAKNPGLTLHLVAPEELIYLPTVLTLMEPMAEEKVSDKIPMTVLGKRLLDEELKHLMTVERPTIIKAIEVARGHG